MHCNAPTWLVSLKPCEVLKFKPPLAEKSHPWLYALVLIIFELSSKSETHSYQRALLLLFWGALLLLFCSSQIIISYLGAKLRQPTGHLSCLVFCPAPHWLYVDIWMNLQQFFKYFRIKEPSVPVLWKKSESKNCPSPLFQKL